MQDNNFIIYPNLDLKRPQIPERSTLYSLEPIGVGTPHCESLTSYLTRLASAHCVKLDKIIQHNIYPLFWNLDDSSQDSRGIISRTFKHHSYLKTLNIN